MCATPIESAGQVPQQPSTCRSSSTQWRSSAQTLRRTSGGGAHSCKTPRSTDELIRESAYGNGVFFRRIVELCIAYFSRIRRNDTVAAHRLQSPGQAYPAPCFPGQGAPAYPVFSAHLSAYLLYLLFLNLSCLPLPNTPLLLRPHFRLRSRFRSTRSGWPRRCCVARSPSSAGLLRFFVCSFFRSSFRASQRACTDSLIANAARSPRLAATAIPRHASSTWRSADGRGYCRQHTPRTPPPTGRAYRATRSAPSRTHPPQQAH